jgi:hypothetical protein
MAKVAEVAIGNVMREFSDDDNPDTFGANGKAFVFKDNNSEDKYVVLGIGARVESEGVRAGQIADEVIEWVKTNQVPGVERNFDFTLTEDFHEFKENDPWKTDREAPSSDILNALFGIKDKAMKIS